MPLGWSGISNGINESESNRVFYSLRMMWNGKCYRLILLVLFLSVCLCGFWYVLVCEGGCVCFWGRGMFGGRWVDDFPLFKISGRRGVTASYDTNILLICWYYWSGTTTKLKCDLGILGYTRHILQTWELAILFSLNKNIQWHFTDFYQVFSH